MKKQFIICIMCAMTLCACGTETNKENEISEITETTTNDLDVETETIEELGEQIQNEINEIAEDYQPQKETKSLSSICDKLEEQNVVSGAKTEMAGEMIGAVSGIKYSDCSIEIYEYELDSEKYKGIEDNGIVKMEGFDYEVSVSVYKNGYIAIGEGITEDFKNAFYSIVE